MVFSSSVFLFVFFPIVLGGYYILPTKVRNLWLLAASLVFYAWNKPEFLWILLGNVTINYVAARIINSRSKIKAKKGVLIVGVSLNLFILFYFKYFTFIVHVINSMLKTGINLQEIILPIGISFFTFQGLSYVIDVYRGDVPVQKNYIKLATYICMFPQLVAGPIVRYKDIYTEINTRHVTLDDFTAGISRFILGLFKKIVIADTLALVADEIFALSPEYRGGVIAWIGILAYTFQIFFDFSGYSDMAIGMGRMFGFHFRENFNFPYISTSITEFWRRWHISLSSFFRDYVYIPLGGNRKHTYFNVAVVFLLTGIWHGAAYTYVFWGIWHGFFNIMEKFINSKIAIEGKRKILNFVGHIYTLLVVIVGWVFFRADGLHAAVSYLRSMFGLTGAHHIAIYSPQWFLTRWTVLVFILAILWSTPLFKKLGEWISEKISGKVLTLLKYVGLLALLFFCILRVASNTYTAFIYFQF